MVMGKMPLWNETKKYMEKNYNSNFHNLDWSTQEWMKALCRVIEIRLKKIEEDKIDWEI